MEVSESLKTSLILVALSVLTAGSFAAAHNVVTPDEPVNVGMVEVETRCAGVDIGACIGIQRQTHTTYNYDNYTEIEEGTPNYYRKVESELMLRATNTCTEEMDGMEWTSEVSYENRTADEWLENENIQLLPCEKTYYRTLNATR
ncbi:hypothetical protein [Candidatus Nanohalococcus occultus]|uniref:hypothetical protein n=1 Tax=Candidatus Nanohalococcus occultus TaxID=2978047 RepID=UPI0039E09CB6